MGGGRVKGALLWGGGREEYMYLVGEAEAAKEGILKGRGRPSPGQIGEFPVEFRDGTGMEDSGFRARAVSAEDANPAPGSWGGNSWHQHEKKPVSQPLFLCVCVCLFSDSFLEPPLPCPIGFLSLFLLLCRE